MWVRACAIFFFLSQVYILKHNSTVWFLFRGFLFAYMWWERKGGVSDVCEFACCESYALSCILLTTTYQNVLPFFKPC